MAREIKLSNLYSLLLDREGVDYFFVKLHERKVPVLILSAGIGGESEMPKSMNDVERIPSLTNFSLNKRSPASFSILHYP